MELKHTFSRMQLYSCHSEVPLHQKMKFSIQNFFSKCGQIRRKLRIRSHEIIYFLWCTKGGTLGNTAINIHLALTNQSQNKLRIHNTPLPLPPKTRSSH